MQSILILNLHRVWRFIAKTQTVKDGELKWEGALWCLIFGNWVPFHKVHAIFYISDGH